MVNQDVMHRRAGWNPSQAPSDSCPAETWMGAWPLRAPPEDWASSPVLLEAQGGWVGVWLELKAPGQRPGAPEPPRPHVLGVPPSDHVPSQWQTSLRRAEGPPAAI